MAATTETVKTYIASGTIKHDGKFYYQGDSIDLADTEAEPLLRVGAVAAKPEPEVPEGGEDPEAKGNKKSKAATE